MDALVLALWARENRPRLVNRELRETWVRGAWRIGLDFAGGPRVTISLERFHPAIFVDERGPGRPTGGLPDTMASIMSGARVLGLDAIDGERIGRIRTDRGALMIELIPSRPTMAWVDEEGTVVSTYLNGKSARHRLVIGAPYRLPETSPDLRFPGLDRRIEQALAPPPSASWDEIVDRALSDPPRIHRVGTRHVVSPIPLPGFTEIGSATSYDEAVRNAFVAAARAEREAAEAREFQGRVRALHRRLQRTGDGVRQDLETARSWPKWERLGSALVAAQHLVGRGRTEAVVPDVFDPDGASVTVPIDPRLSPAENAAGYLKRASRGKRSVAVIEERLARLDEDLAWVESRRSQAPPEWIEEDRVHLDGLLVRYRLRNQAPAVRRRAGPPASKYHPRRYLSRDGWTILVGRNNEENDWLSLRYAKPTDVWLHAQGVAGSHVLIRRENRKDNPSRQALEEAARLAAAFSKARHAGTVPVIYTLAKYVRKPRKARPGLVTCTREKTLMVVPADLKEVVHADEEESADGKE